MRKLFSLFLLLIFLSGCATYKFQLGKKPYDKGYVTSRDDYTILEYSIGRDNSLPADLGLAKERFKRRRKIVEHYYKKMGYIENHFKMTFWNPCIYTFKTMKGLFRLPFLAISDYRYEHNLKYKERIIEIEDEKEAREEAYIQGWKDKLNRYIQQDIVSEDQTEGLGIARETAPAQDIVADTLARIEKEISSSPETDLSHQPVAIIIAKPIKGFSPLKVRFYGYKSHAKGAKLVSYHWDFGDGDTSAQINPANTYYSGSFAPQYFGVTLTVQDDQGNTAEATTTIEVLNK